MAESTNYSKSSMGDLSEKLADEIKKFDETIADMNAQVDVCQENWVENDSTAQAILSELISKKDKYVSRLAEVRDTITKFQGMVNNQIDNYSDAEAKIRSVIGGGN